jgi:hypothetical protein
MAQSAQRYAPQVSAKLTRVRVFIHIPNTRLFFFFLHETKTACRSLSGFMIGGDWNGPAFHASRDRGSGIGRRRLPVAGPDPADGALAQWGSDVGYKVENTAVCTLGICEMIEREILVGHT